MIKPTERLNIFQSLFFYKFAPYAWESAAAAHDKW